MCFILSGRRSLFDRLLLYDREQRAAPQRSGCICGNTIYFKKKQNLTILNSALLGEFASDLLDVEWK